MIEGKELSEEIKQRPLEMNSHRDLNVEVLPNSVLVLLRNSWGEIEWVLPVLWRLKQLNPSARIYTVFSSDSFYEEKFLFPALFRLLEDVSECVYRPFGMIGVETTWAWPVFASKQLIVDRSAESSDAELRIVERWEKLVGHLATLREKGEITEDVFEAKLEQVRTMAKDFQIGLVQKRETRSEEIENDYIHALLERELPEVKFDVIIRDAGYDFRFHQKIIDRFPEAPVIRGEHGFDLTNRAGSDVDQEFAKLAKKSMHLRGRADLWLTCCQNLSEYLRVYWKANDISEVGFPRLDLWWVEQVLEASANEITEMNLPNDCQPVLWLTRHVDDHCFTQESWTRIVRGTLKVISERPHVHLIVKPHPRQDLALLVKELEVLPSERWTLWMGSTLSAASKADVVISVWTSAILDAMAAGKPIIEYFEYPKEQINQAVGRDGQVTGGWREFGLVAPADSPADVHRLLDLWETEPNHEIWESQRKAFEELHPPSADHSEVTVREIARVVGTFREAGDAH